MNGPYLLDTGPWVASLDERDQHHVWAVEALLGLRPPLRSCEPVVTETCFLMGRDRGAVLAMISRNGIDLPFRLSEHALAVEALMSKYADVPMALADACLVRMAELEPNATIITCDGDFQIYRKHREKRIRLLMPPTASRS